MNPITIFERRSVPAVEVTKPYPPLVVALGRGHFAWVQDGRGHTYSPASARWQPLETAVGLGGRVLDAAEVAELVALIGRPPKPLLTPETREKLVALFAEARRLQREAFAQLSAGEALR